MRRVLGLLIGALLLTAAAHGQAVCSASSPCVKLSWTASGMAATVTTNTSGVQTAGPGFAVVLSCNGGTTSTCTQASLNNFLAAQTPTNLCPSTTQSVWNCVTKSLTSTSATYQDPEPYGSLMNYAVQSAWTGGGVSAATPIVTFQIPQAPSQTAPVPGTPSVVFVTSGNVG